MFQSHELLVSDGVQANETGAYEVTRGQRNVRRLICLLNVHF